MTLPLGNGLLSDKAVAYRATLRENLALRAEPAIHASVKLSVRLLPVLRGFAGLGRRRVDGLCACLGLGRQGLHQVREDARAARAGAPSRGRDVGIVSPDTLWHGDRQGQCAGGSGVLMKESGRY
jgi:hypothetical protein